MDSNSLFLIAVSLVILVALLKIITANEKKLFYLILLALFFHLALLLFMQFDINRFYHHDVIGSRFFNDGEAYSSSALIISNVLRNKDTKESFFFNTPGITLVSTEVFEAAKKKEIVKPTTYEVGYITYLYSIIYAAYGYAPAFLNFINICLSIFTALIIFSISKYSFNRVTAYIATTLFLFWPTVFYYSTTKVKEPLIIFLCYLLLFGCIKIKNKINVLFLFFPIYILLEALRPHFYLPFLLVILGYIWLKEIFPNKPLRSLSIFLIIFVIVIKRQLIFNSLIYFLISSVCLHKGYLLSGGFTYSLFASNPNFMNYNFLDWLIYFVRGWYHLIFEPLFSTAQAPLFVVFCPFKIIFLLFCIFSVFGLIISIRQNNKNNFLLVAFFLSYGSLFAITE